MTFTAKSDNTILIEAPPEMDIEEAKTRIAFALGLNGGILLKTITHKNEMTVVLQEDNARYVVDKINAALQEE